MSNINAKHSYNAINQFLANGGQITKCPTRSAVSKWDRRMKGPQFVRGGTRLFMGL